MKTFLKVVIAILSVLLLLSAGFGGYFWWQGYNDNKKQSQTVNQKYFENRLYQYKLTFPKNYYVLLGSETSALPTMVRLANYEKKEDRPADASQFDITVVENDTVKGLSNVKDDSLVKELTDQKYTSENISLGGIPAIKFSNPNNLGKNVITVLALKSGKLFRLDFTPATVVAYEKFKSVFNQLINDFQFTTKTTAENSTISQAYAAGACNQLDQQYDPGSSNHSEPLRTSNDTGQTFMPTLTSLCKASVELTTIDPGQQATLWLYTGAGALLAQKTQAVSDGWNTFTFDSPATVTPNAEYILQINLLGGAGFGRNLWPGGETGSGGTYARGHAIIAGFPENDFDFHFREYANEADSDDGDGGTGDGGTGDQAGGQTSTKSTTKSAATTTPAAKDTTPPKEPFNLKVMTLRLTGLTESYVDLEWNKVTDADLAGYLIYYGNKSGSYYYLFDNGTANTIRVDHLVPGQSYFFAARAYDKSGNISKSSNEVEASLLKRLESSYWWIFAIIAGILLISIIAIIVINRRRPQNQFIS